jgi:hypothetical protein
MHVAVDHEARERRAVPWYRRREEKPQSGERAWRSQTERWVNQEIATGTPSGRYLAARRRRVLAALGMTYREALSKLTYEGKAGTS